MLNICVSLVCVDTLDEPSADLFTGPFVDPRGRPRFFTVIVGSCALRA